MKKLSILSAFLFCLFLTGAAFAQNKTAANFAGIWELDAATSKLPERMRVESGTLTVTQTDKQLTVATDFKRAPRTENQSDGSNNNGGMREGGGGNRGGMRGGGNGTATYNLDGNELIIEPERVAGTPSVVIRVKAEVEKDGKLKLVSNRTMETQTGAMTVKTVEVWELLDNGKTLKIARETETPRGSQTAELYFTKKAASAVVASPASVDNASAREAVFQARTNADGTPDLSSVKTISGGVLNGKTTSMPQPEYPPAARAVKASGAVSVQVTVDEQGQVVEATAVSGHPLLRAAAVTAARSAKLSPTRLGGIPVQVTGILVYNFIL